MSPSNNILYALIGFIIGIIVGFVYGGCAYGDEQYILTRLNILTQSP